MARWGQRGLLIVIIPPKYVQPTLGQGPLSYTLPGSIVLARMATCATSMKLSVPPFLPKTRLFRQDLSSPPRLSVLPHSSCPARVSSVLNFSKIIAASSPLNRRDNRGVARHHTTAIDDFARARNAKRNYILSKVLSHPWQLPSQDTSPFSPFRVVSLVTRSVICYLSRTKLSIAHVSRDM